MERWDELWEEVDPESIDENSNLTWQWVKNILLRIKREGDDIISDNKGLLAVKREYLDRIDSLKEREKRIEKISKFLDEGGKELAYDLGASQYMVNQMNQIQKIVRQLREDFVWQRARDDPDELLSETSKKAISQLEGRIAGLETILGIEPR